MKEQDCWKLLENDAFVRWVMHPDDDHSSYWETWIQQDPARPALVDQAREILFQLQQSPPLTDKSALSQEIWEGIQDTLHSRKMVSLPSPRRVGQWWAVAASLGILVMAAGVAVWYSTRSRVVSAQQAVAAAASAADSTLVAYHNNSGKPQKVYLVDGSVVTLEPNSSLSYPRFLAQKNREVTLKGDAFFDIARDPKHPFLVRTGDIVTQVLGTSFRVNADPSKEDVHVVVRTGKVSVYKESDFDNGKPVFYTLLPTQEAIFHKKDQNLAFVQNANKQLLVMPAADNVSLNFDDEPLDNILGRLTNMYHIRIQYNKDSLSQCRLTTSLQEEKLADKLNIICKAINASYHIEGESIVIDGGHCQ
jgi:transmembrane sensor